MKRTSSFHEILEVTQHVTAHSHANKMKMILMVLLVVLSSSVCVMSAGKETATFYQAEEDDDITISWNSPIKTDMSLTNMACFLQSDPVKLLYQMVNSIDVPESQQDQQFAGRVQCDKDALRDGRIRLHVSRLKTEDSGNYWCDLAANYDKMTRRWVLETTEHFVLNVTSRGENRGHEEHNIITPASTEDAEHTAGGPKKEVKSHDLNEVAAGAVLLIGAIICLLGVAQSCLSALYRRFAKDQHRD